MLLNLLQLILNCKKVLTDLSIRDIQKTVDEVFVNDLEPLKETIANPLFGFFADKSGLIYNIRFFSPYIQLAHNNDIRDFKKEKSLDSITSLVIRLYLSPAGQLVTNTGGDSNPFKHFKSDMEESVRFLARTFVAILNDETDFSLDEIKSKILSTASASDPKILEKRRNLFDEIKKIIFKKNVDSIFKDKTIGLLLVHSYIINIFDPCINGSTEDNLKLYLSEIGKFYKQHLIVGGSAVKKFLDIKIDKDVLQAAQDYYESVDSSYFPYSKLNQPQSNKNIPSYIRKRVVNGNVEVVDKFSYEKEDMFSDCADITLLHICNCLFFDNTLFKTKDFNLDHLADNFSSKPLKDFYKKYPKKYTLTDEIRNDWSKVIQDLNEGTDDNSKYPTDHISYKNLKHNELKSGIINMMNVLIKISGLDAKDFLENINNVNLEKRLKMLIERLSIKEKHGRDLKSVAKVNFQGNIEEFDTKMNRKKDFKGILKIKFNYLNAPDGHIFVFFGERHGYVFLDIENCESFFIKDKEKELKKNCRMIAITI